MKYQEYSHIKVVLQDVLLAIDEIKESRERAALRCGPEDTEADIRQALGEVKGINAVSDKLRNIGGEQVSEMVYDRRY